MVDTNLIDTEHPWPWLEAFPEYAEPFFNGREEDSEALLRCVLATHVTVLFGKSGLGKSSLLQAGLFPRLRKECLLPVYVRLKYEKDSGNASEQIAKQFHEQLKTSFPKAYAQLTNSSTNDTLWIELHRTNIALRDDEDQRWTPVFILDQFEEIFTSGAADPRRQQQLFYELGDLMENRIPKTLAERLHTDDDLYEQLNLNMQHYRFLVSLREDYLPDLEQWADLIPQLGPNRYRLLPMSYTQAIAAVEKTGGTLVTNADAINIVRYLSEKQTEQQSGMQQQPKKALIEPTLLSLICSSLNEKRLQAKQPRLTTDNLSKEGSRIVEGFYDTAFSSLPESVRDFVEQHLITADGVRLSYPERSVESGKLATNEHIQTLINKRLIRRESLEDGDHLELVHDRLAQIALQHRLASQQRKEFLRQQQIRRRWVAGIITVMLILIGFAGFMFDAQQTALKAKARAQQAWLDATAMRLAAEGSSMTTGSRQGGTIQGLFKVLAGHQLARSANTDEALQAEYLKFNQLIFIRENLAPITSVAISPNGTRIVSGSWDNTLTLWDAINAQPIGEPLTGHDGPVTSVSFSPDGTRIVSGSWDNTLKLWDAINAQPIGEPLTGHEGPVLSVAFSPDGKHILSGSMDKTLRLWHAETGKIIGKPLTGHLSGVSSVGFSPDGKLIVSGSQDSSLRLWNATSRKSISKPLTGHKKRITSITFSPDGSRIVSGSEDNSLRLWDAINARAIGEPLIGHTEAVTSLAFSPDGSRIISASYDKTLRLWDAITGKSIGEPTSGHTDIISSVTFSPDGCCIASGSWDKTLRLWDASIDKGISKLFKGHEKPVRGVAFSPDGKRIISASEDYTLRLWNASTGEPIGEPITGHEGPVTSVAFSPDGSRIASGSHDYTLRLWDTLTKKQIGGFIKGHLDKVTSVAFSPDGKRIVSASEDYTLRLWNASTGEPIGKPFTGHEEAIRSVAFSPDGSRIVSGSWDKTLRLWNATTGEPIGKPLTGHKEAVRSVVFSPDGAIIASSSHDFTLRLWNATTGELMGEPLTGHEGPVTVIAFSPDSKRIVSGSHDSTLRLWDATTGKPVGQPLRGHKEAVRSIAFSPDGNRIISGSHDKMLRLWSVFEEWADVLCNKVGRNMNQQEWQDWVSAEIEYKKQCPDMPIPLDNPDKAG